METVADCRRLPRLQYISQGATPELHVEAIRRVLDAGVNWIQLRLKNQPVQVVRETAGLVRKMCDRYEALFIVNDFPRVALETGADGVHLGLGDGPVSEARGLLGPQAFIGGTANTAEDLKQRAAEGCNYIGLGPYRFTKTKQKLSPILGIAGFRERMAGFAEGAKGIPVYAIGGLEPGDLPALLETGVYGVALSGFLTGAAAGQVTQLYRLLNEYKIS